MNKNLASLAVAAALGACASDGSMAGGGDGSSRSDLAGTSWQLVEFLSMDDAQGARRPGDPTRYRLTFGRDGQLSAQLDCNRGVGTWRQGPAGRLEIGPLGMTRMACPEGSMDTFVGARLGEVRTYVIQDGRLHMNLKMDSGNLVWEPAPSPR